jgi:transposase
MSRARVAVLQIVSKQLTVTAAAAEYGISRRHLHRLLARYQEGGLDALEPRSRRPKTTPIATPETVRQRVIELRGQLTADGLDAGPVTIGWHLEREGLPALSTSTIRRILHAAGLITPEPRKRPRSSYTRFEMAQPNEMWQSDFIHWHLAEGTGVEVLNWLDDHSRYLFSCTAHEPVTGDDVVTVFLGLIEEYGPPASTLTDNGSVYTSRFTGGATRSNTSCRCSVSGRRTAHRAIPRPRARPSGFTRPCSAGSPPDQPPGPSPSFKDSWRSSASTTTNDAPTEPSTVERRARPTAPPRKPRQRATDTRRGITASATTGSTPKAR